MALLIIILIVFLLCIYFLISKIKSKKIDKRLINVDNNRSKSQNSKIHKSINKIIDDIDLDSTSKFVNNKDMYMKCMRAGVRSQKKQKMFIFARYAAVLPLAILAFCVAMPLVGGNAIWIIIGTLAGGALGFYYPVIRLASMAQDRQKAIDKGFPDFIDLMLVCVESGMSAEQTYARIGEDFKQFSTIMAEEIEILSGEITYFLDPNIAYDNFYFRTNNEYIKAFNSVVLQSLQYGTPLAQGLRMLSAEVRESQMAKIERQAASLQSKLTVPMMLFTLPVLMTVILYPAISQVMEQF